MESWFCVQVEIRIRRCRKTDLPTLEWFGLFDPGCLSRQYRRQNRGEAGMLIAEANGVASGQVWVEFPRIDDRIGVLWALRVFPNLQGLGVGTRLIKAGERLIRRRGGREVELEVHPENVSAKRLYERLGYVDLGQVQGDSGHLLMRKQLEPTAVARSPAVHREFAEFRRSTLHVG